MEVSFVELVQAEKPAMRVDKEHRMASCGLRPTDGPDVGLLSRSPVGQTRHELVALDARQIKHCIGVTQESNQFQHIPRLEMNNKSRLDLRIVSKKIVQGLCHGVAQFTRSWRSSRILGLRKPGHLEQLYEQIIAEARPAFGSNRVRSVKLGGAA